MSDNENKSAFSALASTVQEYVRLLIEDTRLNVADKLTRLLAAIALASMLTIIVTAALLFASISAGLALSMVMNPVWAFIIVAAFFLLLMGLLIIFRTQLLVNPIARFITRLLLPAPQPNKSESNDKPASVSE